MEQDTFIDEMRPADIASCVKILIENPLWQRYGMTSEAAESTFATALAQGATILIARAQGQKVHHVFLLVTDSNSSAQRFYRRLGYTHIGAIPDYVVPGITELIFFKKLPDSARA
jgi:hypothetical protein